jgi:hypothetical protein
MSMQQPDCISLHVFTHVSTHVCTKLYSNQTYLIESLTGVGGKAKAEAHALQYTYVVACFTTE